MAETIEEARERLKKQLKGVPVEQTSAPVAPPVASPVAAPSTGLEGLNSPSSYQLNQITESPGQLGPVPGQIPGVAPTMAAPDNTQSKGKFDIKKILPALLQFGLPALAGGVLGARSPVGAFGGALGGLASAGSGKLQGDLEMAKAKQSGDSKLAALITEMNMKKGSQGLKDQDIMSKINDRIEKRKQEATKQYLNSISADVREALATGINPNELTAEQAWEAAAITKSGKDINKGASKTMVWGNVSEEAKKSKHKQMKEAYKKLQELQR